MTSIFDVQIGDERDADDDEQERAAAGATGCAGWPRTPPRGATSRLPTIPAKDGFQRSCRSAQPGLDKSVLMPCPLIGPGPRGPGSGLLVTKRSMGSRRAVWPPGHMPKNIPVRSRRRTRSRPGRLHHGREGREGVHQQLAYAAPITIPSTPPTPVSVMASVRNWPQMSRRVAPSALRTPISARALGDRHQHDVHDTHAAHHQADRGDGDHHDVDAAGDLACGGSVSVSWVKISEVVLDQELQLAPRRSDARAPPRPRRPSWSGETASGPPTEV